MSEDTKLPELPEPDIFFVDRCGVESGYSTDLVRQIAKQAAEAEREACAICCDVEAARRVQANDSAGWESAHYCADAIRERGTK